LERVSVETRVNPGLSSISLDSPVLTFTRCSGGFGSVDRERNRPTGWMSRR
jgi:hypothetical protein